MAALGDPARDAGDGGVRRRQAQIDQFDAVSGGAAGVDAAGVGARGQRRFQHDVGAGGDQFVQPRQHQPPGRQITPGPDQAPRHLVRIDEPKRLRPLPQELVDEGGLPGAVRLGEEDEGEHGLTLTSRPDCSQFHFSSCGLPASVVIIPGYRWGCKMPNEQQAESLASKLSGYRAGEIPAPDADHVLRWAYQFPEEYRAGLLSELNHVLNATYFSRETAVQFLDGLLTNAALSGANAGLFWHQANLLDIQQNGHSQTEMLALFKTLMEARYGLSQGQPKSNVFIYIDDVIFTGNRTGNDLDAWIKTDAPNVARVHIIVLALHTGSWQLESRLKKAAADAGKDIKFAIWRLVQIENRKAYRDAAEILWPVYLPESATEYAAGRFPFEPRRPGGTKNPFSSEEARLLLEVALLEAGMLIRSFSANPASNLRPLGYSPFGVGFGSTIVTYRNCPNNAPLALWWGDPSAGRSHPFSKWRPLVPRKTYG